MTVQALRILKMLKTVQKFENYYISVDLNEGTITRVTDADNWELHFDLDSFPNYWRSALYLLIDKKLVDRKSPYAIQLTHRGFHYWQTVLSALLRFLLTSIVVPIVVAALTTLATLWLQGAFSG